MRFRLLQHTYCWCTADSKSRPKRDLCLIARELLCRRCYVLIDVLANWLEGYLSNLVATKDDLGNFSIDGPETLLPLCHASVFLLGPFPPSSMVT